MADAGQEDAMKKRADFAKEGFEKALSNMRELAEMAAKSQKEAFEVVRKRIEENVEGIRNFGNKQVNKLRFAKPQQRQCSRVISGSARRRKDGDRSAFREILAETPGRGAADDGIALGQSSGLVRLWALSPCSALPTNTRTEYEGSIM